MTGRNYESPRNILQTLFSVIILDQTALTITFPLLTLIFFDSQSRLFHPETSYAIRSFWYGTCVAIPNLLNLFFSPYLSSLSDEVGRKKILLIEVMSALFFTLALALGVYLGIMALIFLGFMIKGCFARSNPTALSIIGDAVHKEKKIIYMGYLQCAIAFGAFVGPIIGGVFAKHYWFDQLNFSLPFFIAALIALVNSAFASYYMPETLKYRIAPHNRWQTFKTIFSHPPVIQTSLILLLIQMSWSMYYQYMPPILKITQGATPYQLGFFIGMIAFWLMVTTGIGIPILKRFLNIRQMLMLSTYFIICGLLISLLACQGILRHQYWFWFAAFPTAAGDVIAYSCLTALYSNLLPKQQQGKVMGLSIFLVASTWSSTAFIGGVLLSYSPLLPLIVAPSGVITALFLIQGQFGKQLAAAYHKPPPIVV